MRCVLLVGRRHSLGDFHDENPFCFYCGRCGGCGAGLLAGAGSAQARDVNWSVGIGVPGVVVGASNGYYAPAPVYVAPPPPVYYAPPPRPVYYNAPPVYYTPPPAVVYGGYGYGHRHHGHGHGHGHGRHWDR